jgi:hypothetical protein
MVLMNKKQNRFCIAALISLLYLGPAAEAQEAEGPRIIVRNTPEVPAAGSFWTLSLLIDHSEPNEVIVMAPPFTDSLFLDQVSKISRMINPATGHILSEKTGGGEQDPAEPGVYERWTLMEYRFLLNSSRMVSLDAFTVISPRGKTLTAPLSVRVQRPRAGNELLRPQLSWEGVPPGLISGQSAEFTLRIKGWNSPTPLPGPHWFMPVVPTGVILESMPLAPEEQAAGLALRLRLIPLNANAFVLPARVISQGSALFEIPGLRIPVKAPFSAPANSAAGMEPAAGKTEPENAVSPSFPEFAPSAAHYPNLAKKHQSGIDNIYRTAKNLWERGYRADALASMRKHERDHPAGPLFAALRREAEQELGLRRAKDEAHGKFRLPRGRRRDSGVVRDTVVRRVPDSSAEAAAHFKEGQSVRVPPESRGPWVWVTANDDSGVSGWIPEEKIIYY